MCKVNINGKDEIRPYTPVSVCVCCSVLQRVDTPPYVWDALL